MTSPLASLERNRKLYCGLQLYSNNTHAKAHNHCQLQQTMVRYGRDGDKQDQTSGKMKCNLIQWWYLPEGICSTQYLLDIAGGRVSPMVSRGGYWLNITAWILWHIASTMLSTWHYTNLLTIPNLYGGFHTWDPKWTVYNGQSFNRISNINYG